MSFPSSQRHTTMLEFALAHSSDRVRLSRLVDRYTDARFQTANLILAALLRPFETQDPTMLGHAVYDAALGTAMSLSGEIAQVYRDTIDSRIRPTFAMSSSLVASVTAPASSFVTFTGGIAPARHIGGVSTSPQAGLSAPPAGVVPQPPPETPVVWQWTDAITPNFAAMYLDAETPAQKAAVSRVHDAFLRAL